VRSFLLRLITWLLLLAAIGGGLFYYVLMTPLELRREVVTFDIPNGAKLKASAQLINEAGVEISPWLFTAAAKATRSEAKLKAGSYEVREGLTLWQLLKKLTRGDVNQGEIRLPEGWTFRQFRQRLNNTPDLQHTTEKMTDAELLQALQLPTPNPEGLFFPDTYLFNKNSKDIDILKRAHHIMLTRLEAEWTQRDANLPYRTPYEALTMASIVEKETGKAADRGLVAAVFVNRLKRGMRLQTDPTVIYGMGTRFDGNIRKADLQTDTPYNTYTRNGLPPTPISMPSLASLQAALHPAESEALYFVARGDGSSQFSRTLEEHNQAVNRYQRGRP
jgi:UPF0755 protein